MILHFDSLAAAAAVVLGAQVLRLLLLGKVLLLLLLSPYGELPLLYFLYEPPKMFE